MMRTPGADREPETHALIFRLKHGIILNLLCFAIVAVVCNVE